MENLKEKTGTQQEFKGGQEKLEFSVSVNKNRD